MTKQQISLVVTISARFTEVRVNAKEAHDAVNRLLFSLPSDICTPEQKDILKQAMQTLSDIKSDTSEYAAIAYAEREISKQ